MSSLYNISEDILRIFNNVENNDGEITDEEYEILCIKQEELKSKLDSYYKAIQVWKGDLETCKCEKRRIGDVQKKYDNRIERLKKAMLDAVRTFGEHGKNNMFIELPTVRLFTKTTKSVVIDEDRVKIFINAFMDFTKELVDNDALYTGEDVDLQGVLDSINAIVIAEQGENFEPFTLADMNLLNVKFGVEYNISSLLKLDTDIIKSVVFSNFHGFVEPNISKDEAKSAIEFYSNSDSPNPTIASIIKNDTLQMR